MRTRYKTYKFFAFFFLALAILDIGTYFTFAVANLLTDDMHYLEIFFAVSTPTIIVIWASFFLAFIEYSLIYRSLKVENLHYLGKECDFYNFNLFNKALRILPKEKAGFQYYIMSFTPCNSDVANNTSRNAIVAKFNGLIADMLHDYFLTNNVYKKFDHFYCYYRGSFNIFIKGDQNRINNILRELEVKIYDVAKENEIRIFVQPFFGISNFHKGDDLSITLENATIARFQAEKNFELSSFYNGNLKNTDVLNDAQEIIDAIKEKEFVVFYQPKFSLDTKTFVSSEALIRWESKKYGFLNPGMFIEKAEKAGLIHEIDMYVFNRVCENLNEAKRRGKRIIPVSINFSIYEFFSPNFVEDIVKIIDSNNIPHWLIEIEITETTTQSNPFLAISIMKKLKKAGLRVLMDDFGVGFSNFTNLRKLPIDGLKIDKSFVDLIEDDSKSREIMKFLINLGRVNELEVIAEGVDNKNQVEILSKAKLNTIQGYYYSKPLSFKDYCEFLRNNPFEKRGGGTSK